MNSCCFKENIYNYSFPCRQKPPTCCGTRKAISIWSLTIGIGGTLTEPFPTIHYYIPPTIHRKVRRTKAQFFKNTRHSERNPCLKALCPDIPQSISLKRSNDSLNYWGQNWTQGTGLETLLIKADNIIKAQWRTQKYCRLSLSQVCVLSRECLNGTTSL